MSTSYKDWKQNAADISKSMPTPVFYAEKAHELNESSRLVTTDGQIDEVRKISENREKLLGHGYHHAHSVAVESGAIVFSEMGYSNTSLSLARHTIIAGYLHDICRDQKNHALRGAEEAERILDSISSDLNIEMILFAIRNHEAFRDHEIIDDENYMMVSNSLYDSDKFRWGPDNFTYTVWDMAESMNIPVEMLTSGFFRGMEALEKIKDTFRTKTGKKYGPDFIDKGLCIGRELIKMMGM